MLIYLLYSHKKKQAVALTSIPDSDKEQEKEAKGQDDEAISSKPSPFSLESLGEGDCHYFENIFDGSTTGVSLCEIPSMDELKEQIKWQTIIDRGHTIERKNQVFVDL